MSLKSGHKAVPLTGQEHEKQVQEFKGNHFGTIRLQPGGWFYMKSFLEVADKIYDFKFKSSDVIMMTYPKCGTTWTQEIVWTMLNNPNLDNPDANLPIMVCSPFIEADMLMSNMPPLAPGNDIYDIFVQLHPDKKPEDGIFFQYAELAPTPRVIKTHLPLSAFPVNLLDTCKMIYVVRNPKDVAVSYYHHSRLLLIHGFIGSLDSFVDHFVNDTLIFSPYWTHVKETWAKRQHPNLHFIFYEDMKENPRAEIIRLQEFLNTKLTDEQIDNILKYTSFSSMKARDNALGVIIRKSETNLHINVDVCKSDGGFFRKGVTGDWKTKLTEEQVAKIDQWIRKNMADFGPDFKYGKEVLNN